MSCLFNSLHHFIPNESSHSIRQKICDYLQNNSPIMDGLETADILQLDSGPGGAVKYIESMRNVSTWGGAIEIQAACNLWSFRIIVRNNREQEKSIIEFLPISELLRLPEATTEFNHTPSTSSTEYNQKTSACKQASVFLHLPADRSKLWTKTIELKWTGGHYEPVRS
jgi:hypothetical protein